MIRNRWRQELRKPKSEGGATICEKHDFALEHYSDPEMDYEVGEALRQAKDDGERMEKRIQELGEEANNLQDVLEETEKELELARKALAEALPHVEASAGAGHLMDGFRRQERPLDAVVARLRKIAYPVGE